jgi:hypothetical protein
MKKDEDFEIQLEAAATVKDDSLISKIAIKHPCEQLRLETIYCIKTQDSLITVATSAKCFKTRREAISRLSDKFPYRKLIDRDPEVIQEVFKQIAIKDSNSTVRRKAVIKIIDIKFLNNIHENDKAKIVRRSALQHMRHLWVMGIGQDVPLFPELEKKLLFRYLPIRLNSENDTSRLK